VNKIKFPVKPKTSIRKTQVPSKTSALKHRPISPQVSDTTSKLKGTKIHHKKTNPETEDNEEKQLNSKSNLSKKNLKGNPSACNPIELHYSKTKRKKKSILGGNKRV